MTKRFLAFLLLSSAALFAQGGGYSTVAWIKSPGNLARVLPNASVVVCSFPGTGGTPCTNLAATFTDAGTGTGCPSNAQIVVPGSSSCTSTADSAGNIGFFAAFGNYVYYFQNGTTWQGPFTATIGGGGGGGGGGGVSNVATGTGLSGGPITSTGTISILASYRLPQGCSANQISQWNGSTWVCLSLGGLATLAESNGTVAYGTGGVWTTSSAPTISAANMTSFPTFNQNTSGTASQITGALTIANTPLTTTGDVLTIAGGVLARVALGGASTFLGNCSGSLGFCSVAGAGTVTNNSGNLSANVPAVGNTGADIATLDHIANKYLDIPATATSWGNPAAGSYRISMNTNTGLINCLTSGGVNCAPNNVPLGAAGTVAVMNAGATAWAPVPFSQDCTITSAGVVTCLKTNNVSFTGAATMALPVSATNGGSGLNTSGSTGVPQVSAGTWSVSTTLPSGLNATNLNLTTPALGTPSSGTLTNATGLPLAGLAGETDGNIIAGIGGVWTKTTALPGSTGGPSITAATQGLGDSSTKVATDQFVLQNALTNPLTTTGDTIYGVGSTATRLAGPTTPATPFVLTSTPSGGLATAPFWNISGLTMLAPITGICESNQPTVNSDLG